MYLDNSQNYGSAQDFAERFENKIRDKAFPCVGAKSALARHNLQLMTVGDIRCPRDDRAVYSALRDFAQAYKSEPGPFQSFVVIFDTQQILDEHTFEQALWARLQALEDMDAEAGFDYDPRVSADPDDASFSLSFAGEAFFVVGLHPGASRRSRQFDAPALVFNSHHQFESLRADGRYETMRETILKRDEALCGSPNQMVARHGDMSEARQYSGRLVTSEWSCPFLRAHR